MSRTGLIWCASIVITAIIAVYYVHEIMSEESENEAYFRSMLRRSMALAPAHSSSLQAGELDDVISLLQGMCDPSMPFFYIHLDQFGIGASLHTVMLAALYAWSHRYHVEIVNHNDAGHEEGDYNYYDEDYCRSTHASQWLYCYFHPISKCDATQTERRLARISTALSPSSSSSPLSFDIAPPILHDIELHSGMMWEHLDDIRDYDLRLVHLMQVRDERRSKQQPRDEGDDSTITNADSVDSSTLSSEWLFHEPGDHRIAFFNAFIRMSSEHPVSPTFPLASSAIDSIVFSVPDSYAYSMYLWNRVYHSLYQLRQDAKLRVSKIVKHLRSKIDAENTSPSSSSSSSSSLLPFACIHMRGGDKALETKSFTATDYHTALHSSIGHMSSIGSTVTIQSIFVMSDEPHMISELKAMSSLPTFVDDSLGQRSGDSSLNGDDHGKASHVFHILANVEFCSLASVIVVTFSSNVGRMIANARIGKAMTDDDVDASMMTYERFRELKRWKGIYSLDTFPTTMWTPS
jgi:hypothetical protein